MKAAGITSKLCGQGPNGSEEQTRSSQRNTNALCDKRSRGWTRERVETLKALWAKGWSASQIANCLGGVTRSAVIGKVYRLGLSGRTTTNRIYSKRKASPRRAPVPNPLPRQERATPKPDRPSRVDPGTEGLTVATMPLHRACRWPMGDPHDDAFRFCGASCDPGQPYCEAHHAIAYRPASSSAKARDRAAHVNREVKARQRRASGLSRHMIDSDFGWAS